MCEGTGSVRRRGGRGEDGSLTVFSLFIIICMLILGGLAVDFMRQEAMRSRLQSTLDRAVLAAADLDQTLDPRAVVEDYFAKAGLDGYQLNVGVSQELTSRRVTASVTKTIDSYFLKFLGIDTLDAPAGGTAEESLSNIEISLVLDISGSMGSNRKIDNLKVAAKDFIDTILAQTVPGKTTISIVPYSTQVNAGAKLLKHFNVTAEHSYSNCVDFAAADFDATTLSPATLLQRTAHFDPTANQSTRTPATWVCRTTGGTEVLPPTLDPTKLKAKIDSLVATGYTSIELGVKWGSALLDPSTRPALAAMISDGDLGLAASGRPYAYEPGKTLKVIVVMTDGINTTQWLMDPRYKSGPSDVWMDPATKRLSIKRTELLDQDMDGIFGETYYLPRTGKWSNTPEGGAAAVRLSYPELWANVGVNYNARQMANAALDALEFLRWTSGLTNALTGLFEPGAISTVEHDAKDARLDRICTAAKSEGIRIYSIGFEVTNDSAAVMRKCATTPSHFFRVEGTQISSAFAAIANDIGKLRLTQ